MRLVFAWLILPLALFVSLDARGPVRAAESGQAGLTVSPIIQDLSLQPGSRSTGFVKLTNPTNQVLSFRVAAVDFRAKDESGEPAFYSGEASSPYALRTWLSFPTVTYSLQPLEAVEVSYTIAVPSQTEPGGHYGSIIFTQAQATSGSGASQVALQVANSSLLLVRIPGAIQEQARVESFQPGKPVFSKGPVELLARIGNQGNVHLRPYGELVVKNLLGHTVAEPSLNPNAGVVLPGSIRVFSTNVENSLLPGYYRVDLVGFYGSNQSLIGSTSFWYLPVWFLLSVAILVLVTYWIIRYRPRLQFRS